ncbi:MAG: hypothetical protein N4A44_03555 [Alphaproteobacteria bacterium]|jgi:hypothetical protein|nr:hypothetical protein [Alphaproteobacteria bacterium]
MKDRGTGPIQNEWADKIKKIVEAEYGIVTDTSDYEELPNKNLHFKFTPFYKDEEEFLNFYSKVFKLYLEIREFGIPFDDEFVKKLAKSQYHIFSLPIDKGSIYPGDSKVLSPNVFRALIFDLTRENNEIKILSYVIEYYEKMNLEKKLPDNNSSF